MGDMPARRRAFEAYLKAAPTGPHADEVEGDSSPHEEVGRGVQTVDTVRDRLPPIWPRCARASNRRRAPPAATPPPSAWWPSPRPSPSKPCAAAAGAGQRGFRREPRPGRPTENPRNGRTSDQVASRRPSAVEQGAKGGVGLRRRFIRSTASTCCSRLDARPRKPAGAGAADPGGSRRAKRRNSARRKRTFRPSSRRPGDCGRPGSWG